MPLPLLEGIVILIFIIYIFTQLILPLFGFYNRRIFWIHRKDENKVSEKVLKLNEMDVKEEQIILDKKIKEKEKELENLAKDENTK